MIIPSHNNEAFVRECLRSIRESSFRDYELIVVDDASADGTAEAARRFADRVIVQPSNGGCSRARNAGAAAASGEICLFIDSDVKVRRDTLARVAAYFDAHPEVDALTGRLAAEHPNPDFFSQYKNLYMNYIFGLLPDRVNFLYGSIHAVRSRLKPSYDPRIRVAHDTELGQRLHEEGRTLAYLNDLEVVHLKRYGFRSLMRNDFIIPFEWTDFFFRHRGYRQLWKKTGYLHAPKEQILSLALMPLLLVSAAAALAGSEAVRPVLAALVAVWSALNARFLFFLGRVRGAVFAFASAGLTFLDQAVMMTALFCGFLAHGAGKSRG
ncbi:MAG TPA: glycosyltransferase family 2 protein [Candidatus Eisenbacteria bacterium]|nr:glycosyltransferase family 2 protein [Candidatus Eisenbacteria bacterium]